VNVLPESEEFPGGSGTVAGHQHLDRLKVGSLAAGVGASPTQQRGAGLDVGDGTDAFLQGVVEAVLDRRLDGAVTLAHGLHGEVVVGVTLTSIQQGGGVAGSAGSEVQVALRFEGGGGARLGRATHRGQVVTDDVRGALLYWLFTRHEAVLLLHGLMRGWDVLGLARLGRQQLTLTHLCALTTSLCVVVQVTLGPFAP